MEMMKATITQLVKEGVRISSFARQESNLESLFMDVTKRRYRRRLEYHAEVMIA